MGRSMRRSCRWRTSGGFRSTASTLVSGRAVGLDGPARELMLSGGRRLKFTHCVMATGAEPTRLPVPGADDPAVRVVRSLDHVRELLARLTVRRGGRGRLRFHRLRDRGVASSSRVDVTLISDEATPNEHGWGRRLEPRSQMAT